MSLEHRELHLRPLPTVAVLANRKERREEVGIRLHKERRILPARRPTTITPPTLNALVSSCCHLEMISWIPCLYKRPCQLAKMTSPQRNRFPDRWCSRLRCDVCVCLQVMLLIPRVCYRATVCAALVVRDLSSVFRISGTADFRA